ncbi:MAG: YHS domain-containing protein [Bdellovibrionales bacterium]|nr:YHS domain-containing protein [Bdellovibrionales bacterium]
MSGLISFLLFGVFFFFMMRFGCGSHMGHGNKKHSSKPGTKDPICGMLVEPGVGYSKMHEHREYRFCSRACLDKFEATPEKYIS